jgi:hypothetical protein
MIRVRQLRKEGWVALEKRWSPQRWVVHWYLNDSYRDKQGTVRYRQWSHVLGLKDESRSPNGGRSVKAVGVYSGRSDQGC